MSIICRTHNFFTPRFLGSQFGLAVLLMTVSVFSASAARAADPIADPNNDQENSEYLEKLTGINLHGFSNMGYAVDNSKDFHHRYYRGFYLNNFDMYWSPDLGDRVRFLAEVVFEPDAESQSPSFDAERLQAGYVINKNLTAWVGRFHTPLGYYVIAYHHGMQLQTAVEKPRFLDFEDHFGVLPVHTNGLWLNGSFTLGEQRFAAMAWVGNSDRMVSDGNGYTMLDFNMLNGQTFAPALGARINWIAAGSLDGLQVGATGLRENIGTVGAGGTPTTYGVENSPAAYVNTNIGTDFTSDMFLYGVHAVYEAHNIEFLNEAYGFHDRAFSNPNISPSINNGQLYKNNTYYTSYAGYSQLAYWINGTMAPYARYERGLFNTADPFFAGQYNGLPYSKYAGGFRYNLADDAAVKFEYSKTEFQGSSATNSGKGYRTFMADYSIRF